VTTSQREAVESHRKRLRKRGFVRVEVQAKESDVPLIRQVAKVLRDNPSQTARARVALREVVGTSFKELNLKQLLAAAPLDGIDLSRPRDLSRTVDL
jgi:hypothetical protein